MSMLWKESGIVTFLGLGSGAVWAKESFTWRKFLTSPSCNSNSHLKINFSCKADNFPKYFAEASKNPTERKAL